MLAILVLLGELEGKPLVSNRMQCRAAFSAMALNPTLTGKLASCQVTLTWTKNTGMIQVQSTARLLEDMENRARGLDRIFSEQQLTSDPEAAEKVTEHLASDTYHANGPIDDPVYLSAIRDIADHASTVLSAYPPELSRLLVTLRRDFGLCEDSSFAEFMHVSTPPIPKAKART